MELIKERRKTRRLHFSWPVWFAEDFAGMLMQGQMVDVSSNSVAFTCHNGQYCPWPGQFVTVRFSVPRFGDDDSMNIINFVRSGNIAAVEDTHGCSKRVALQFAEPLPFNPMEYSEQVDSKQQLG